MALEIDGPDIRERWNGLSETLGADLANYIVCAFVDIPYNPRLSAKNWTEYLAKSKNKLQKHFKDGETDVRSCYSKGMSEQDRWEAEWGVGAEGNRYTAADYRRLDEILKTLSARNSGGMDAQQEYTLRNCAQMALLREKSIWKGDKDSIDKAKSLDKMIQDNLAAENLRKKDAGPAQTARLDGIVEAIKKKHGFGVELTYEQAVEMCSKWLVSHHYNCTRDAAEHAMLSIMNAMRINSDLPILPELPQEASLDDFSSEFERASSPAGHREKAVYDYLGIRRGVMTDRESKEAVSPIFQKKEK